MWLFAVLLFGDSVTARAIPVAPAETLAVTVTGIGEPVLFVPGLFGSAFGARRIAAPLATAGFQLITMEPLGVGRSSRPRGADYSLAAQAHRIAAALDTLGVGPVVAVAHSLGGAIAFRLALERPDLIRAIVSIEGGPAEEATTPGFRLAMRFVTVIKALGGPRVIRAEVHRNLRSASGDPSWVTDDVVDGYTRDAALHFDAAMDAFRGMAASREPWSLRDRLEAIACPVVLLLGAADHKSGVRTEELALLRQALPQLAIDSIPGAGHFIHEERPGAVVDAVRRVGG
ncbi:MAG TPA: alpha/beta hydrolase [Gemmatimonadales bacterium]